MIRALALLCVVLLAHTGYLSATDQAQSWVFYIERGIEGVVVGFALLRTFPKGLATVIGSAACALMIWEEGETAVCGYLAMGSDENGLCSGSFGKIGYGLLIAGAAAFFMWWRSRRNRNDLIGWDSRSDT